MDQARTGLAEYGRDLAALLTALESAIDPEQLLVQADLFLPFARLFVERRERPVEFKRMRELSNEAYADFNVAMPFVPLWQLDRHMVLANGLKFAFDGPDAGSARMLPLNLFAGVNRWRME